MRSQRARIGAAAALAVTMAFTLTPGATQAATTTSQSTAVVPAASAYRMVATRNAATVSGALALLRKAGFRGPNRCYTVYVARHNARYAAPTSSRWAWSHRGQCPSVRDGVALARKVGTKWRWSGLAQGGLTRSECLQQARTARVPLLVAKDFCIGSWVG